MSACDLLKHYSNKYFGIDKIFNTNHDLNVPCLINISDNYIEENISSIFPTGRNDIYSFEKIPQSLYDAILYFLVSIFYFFI